MTSPSDIRKEHWCLRLSPPVARPYLLLMRADRPIGTWLLLLPGWWAILLAGKAQGQAVDFTLLLFFAIGAWVMRGAGCVVNDIADRKYDALVARTATRPLPSGQVTLRQALVFLALLLLVGLAILLQLNSACLYWGAGSLLLVATYPFMKRVTYWPQAFLGLTFNWGALLGWVAVTGEIAWPALLLYGGGFFWTLGYDTIYAHQDREDDALVGVKSTALLLGAKTPQWVALFYLASLALWAAALWQVGGFALLALLVVAGHFAWQVGSLKINDPVNCRTRFFSNRDAGLLLFIGLLIAGLQ